MCTSATWNASKKSSSLAFVSRISLQNLEKQWSKHNFYPGTAVHFSWMRYFFQSHVGFYRTSKIAALELPTRMPWKRIKHQSFVTHLSPSFFPIWCVYLTWELNIYNGHLECIKKWSNLVFVFIVGLQIEVIFMVPFSPSEMCSDHVRLECVHLPLRMPQNLVTFWFSAPN